jgi:hypothetical protein
VLVIAAPQKESAEVTQHSKSPTMVEPGVRI